MADGLLERLRQTGPARLGDLLGPLERRVLDALWERGAGASVRELHPSFPAAVSTTLVVGLRRPCLVLARMGVERCTERELEAIVARECAPPVAPACDSH